jgi:hypothetical protein
MLAQLRLGWRMQRFELAALVGGCLLLALAMTVVAWQLDVSREALITCYEDAAGPLSESCRSTVEWGNLLSGAVGMLGAAATFAPFPVGILLGAPLVAREIEHRTAPIAWSLSVSRRRWLVGRTLPLIVLIGVALLAVGQASELLLSTAEETELGFRHLGMHGPLLAARGLAVFGIGVVIGLSVGRVLPAILLTGLATAALVIGLQVGRDQLMRAEAVWLPMGDQSEVVAMVYNTGFRSDATDEVMTWDEAYEQHPDAFSETTGELIVPGTTAVWLVVPPELYGLFVARELGALMAVLVVVSALAVAVVVARRPE